MPIADLGLTKEGQRDLASGETLTYTLGVTSAGPLSAQSVTVSDTLGPELHHLFSAVEPATDPSDAARVCSYVSPTVTCDLFAVLPGGRVTVTIVTTVTKGFGGIVENSAVVTAASFDPEAGNDSATDRYPLAPVGGATLASGGLGLLVRWLALLVTILFVGGALVTGLSLRRGRR